MPALKAYKMSSAQKRNIVAGLLVLVIFSFFYWRSHIEPVVWKFDESCMTLTAPDGELSVTVAYQDINLVSEITELDAGTNLTGICTDQCWFGTWQNDMYGDYTLCASPLFAGYIVLDTKNGVIVCNYESADATAHLYTALLELLETKQEGK